MERGETQDFQPAGVLADFVEVDPAYEKAAEEFLHEELEYVVVHNWTEAERGVDIHARRHGWTRHVPGASRAVASAGCRTRNLSGKTA